MRIRPPSQDFQTAESDRQLAMHLERAAPLQFSTPRKLQTLPPLKMWPRGIDELLPTSITFFESEAFVVAEDSKRIESLRSVIDLSQKDRQLSASCLVASQTARSLIEVNAAESLAEKLETGIDYEEPQSTLGSSFAYRSIRAVVIGSLLEALADIPNDDLRVFTVLKSTWRLTPEQLQQTSAADIKREFENDLRNRGVSPAPGPLIAFLHGEFEPRSGVYVLHFHGVTTKEKAELLSRLKETASYDATLTKAPPIFRQKIKNRERQISYLLKAFWPQREVFKHEEEFKRVRQYRRINEPYHAQVLIWCDRQRLIDITVTNNTWSKRNGGDENMRRFNLIIARWSKKNAGWGS